MPDGEAGLREPPVAADGAGDTEIGDQRGAVASEHDVFGLYVAVDDAVLVRVIERARSLGRDAKGVFERELALTPEPVAQRLALDEGHREPQLSGRFAGVEHGQDVRMLEPGGEVDLTLEPLGAERGGKLWEENLEGDRTVVAKVLREVDDRHAAAPELALEGVAVGEGVAHTLRHSHAGAPGDVTWWFRDR